MTPEDQRGGPPRPAPRRPRAALSVVVGNERGRSGVAPGLSRWLQHVAPRRARGLISLAIVSDRCVRALNRRYRGVDRATDVLSFSGDGLQFLGEIVIARGVARRQARAAGHPTTTEFRVLALHGLLHLIGYDHDTDRGEMRRIERRLRRKGGLPTGLIERTRRGSAGFE